MRVPEFLTWAIAGKDKAELEVSKNKNSREVIRILNERKQEMTDNLQKQDVKCYFRVIQPESKNDS